MCMFWTISPYRQRQENQEKKEQPGKEGTLTGEETEALSADAILSALQALLQQQEAAGTGQTDIAAEGKAQEAAAGNSSQ